MSLPHVFPILGLNPSPFGLHHKKPSRQPVTVLLGDGHGGVFGKGLVGTLST